MSDLIRPLGTEVQAAALSLFALWTAFADRFVADGEPQFVITASDAPETNLLDLSTAAETVSRVLPGTIKTDWRADLAAVSVIAPYATQEDDANERSFRLNVGRLTPAIGDEAQVLIVGRRTRLVVSPLALEYSREQYRCIGPFPSLASDLPASDWAKQLFPYESLQPYAQIVVCGNRIDC